MTNGGTRAATGVFLACGIAACGGQDANAGDDSDSSTTMVETGDSETEESGTDDDTGEEEEETGDETGEPEPEPDRLIIDGIYEYQRVGQVVGGLGDFDGDGLDDILFGAPAGGENGEKLVYLVNGKPDLEPVLLGDLDAGVGGLVFRGEHPFDGVGRSLSAAGDVNGDGLADVLIGVASSKVTNTGGRSYVVFGTESHEPIDLADVADGVGGFVIDENGGAWAGIMVASAGDLNADGFDDVLIGAPGSGTGGAYLVWGKPDTDPVSLTDVELGMGGFQMIGEDNNEDSGRALAGGGDINGDGVPDILVGAPDGGEKDIECYIDVCNEHGLGRVYVVFGKSDGDPVELTDIAAGIGGFAYEGSAWAHEFGKAVDVAGDVNGDGFDDVVVGTRPANGGPMYRKVEAMVLFGKADTEMVYGPDISKELGGGFVLRGNDVGHESSTWVAGVGDIDGDGLADVAVGGPPDAVHVVYGKKDFVGVELSDVAAGVGGFVLESEDGYEEFGGSVDGAGDFNGDGRPDIVIGANRARPAGNESGRVYVDFP